MQAQRSRLEESASQKALDGYAARLAASAPPLTPEQRDRLRQLFMRSRASR